MTGAGTSQRLYTILFAANDGAAPVGVSCTGMARRISISGMAASADTADTAGAADAGLAAGVFSDALADENAMRSGRILAGNMIQQPITAGIPRDASLSFLIQRFFPSLLRRKEGMPICFKLSPFVMSRTRSHGVIEYGKPALLHSIAPGEKS